MSMIFNALSGAQAAQAALSSTSQNVANAMTPGYSRQGVLLSSVQPQRGGAGEAGSGVAVSALLRFSDGYKNSQLWQASANLGQANSTQPYFNQLEQVMSDDTSNINKGLDDLFAALNAASVQPDSGPLREQVMTAADGLVKRFSSLQHLLDNQRNAITEQRQAGLDQINSLNRDIAKLNEQIAASRGTNINAAGLLDARDLKTDALAALVGVQVVDLPDGTRSVSLKNGQPLVAGSDAATLSVNSSGSMDLQFANTQFKVLGHGLGGQLGGLDDFEQQVLKPMGQNIDELAQGITGKFNTQLKLGYQPDGTAGVDLFVYGAGGLSLTGISASQLAFSASALPANAAGDSKNLSALIALKHQTVNLSAFDAAGQALPTPVPVVMGDVYTQIVGKLGVASQQNQASLKTAQTVRDQSEENWKSTSGVNNDEEAINLMQFKQMYEANMKVIAVANQLFDSTLAMVG
nr:flagellar hook-associated protein FlgK [uncultured Roseateles sp.]